MANWLRRHCRCAHRSRASTRTHRTRRFDEVGSAKWKVRSDPPVAGACRNRRCHTSGIHPISHFPGGVMGGRYDIMQRIKEMLEASDPLKYGDAEQARSIEVG